MEHDLSCARQVINSELFVVVHIVSYL